VAAPKTIAVSSPAYSTILIPFVIDRSLRKIDAVLDRAEQDARFTRTHGISRRDWDGALSLHLHGDLR
jgi:hypothetical protein